MEKTKIIADITKNDINMRLIRFATADSETTYGFYIIKGTQQLWEQYSLSPASIREDFLNCQELFFGEIIQNGLVGEKIELKSIRGKISNSRLGRVLVENEYITESNLKNALNIQKITKEPIGSILLQAGRIKPEELILVLGLQKIRRK